MKLTKVAQELANMVVKAHSIIRSLRYELRKARIRKHSLQDRLDIAESALKSIYTHRTELWETDRELKVDFQITAEDAIGKINIVKRRGFRSDSLFERTIAKELTLDR